MMAVEGVAWVIAVEKYTGAELDLKQPIGTWALEFAELMLKRGVAKVVLSASLGDIPGYAERLTALGKNPGFKKTGAAQADILNTLADIAGTGTLFLYWVGHGIMAPARQLLCADSRKTTELRAVTVDSLLKRLRSPEFPRLQIGFFECCAQVMTTDPDTLTLGGDGKTHTRQFFYYAASAGEQASATMAKSGFSTTVLQSLQEPAPLPPDPGPFFDGLKVALAGLSLQTRPFLQSTEESGDVWSGFGSGRKDELVAAARVADLTPSQFEHLYQEVRSSGVASLELARAIEDGNLAEFIAGLRASQPENGALDLLEMAWKRLNLEQEFEPLCLRLRLLFQDWTALYQRLVREDGIDQQDRIEDLAQILLGALDQDRKENGYKSFLKILVWASNAARRTVPNASQALDEALARHPLIGALYTGVVSDMPDQSDMLYLLLAVDWEPNAKVASLSDAWTFPTAEGTFDRREILRDGTLARQISVLTQQVISEFPERTLKVELLFPNELLCAPQDLLELPNTKFGLSTWLEAQHGMTLRWKDRMKGDEDYFPGTWKKSGLALRARVEQAASLTCAWRPTLPGATAGEFVGLTYPGPSPADPLRNTATFFAELLKGAPYMCWPRNVPPDLATFKQEAADLFGKAQLKTLTTALAECKQNGVLCDLVVLIDEPNRNPYLDLDHLTETGQRGTS